VLLLLMTTLSKSQNSVGDGGGGVDVLKQSRDS
jgi:hypothetical protein